MHLHTLPDGRSLEVEVTGPDDGPVLLFHHGTPGASDQLDRMALAVHDRGHRLVTWSRAGYGTSSRRPGRDVASEAADVAALLDHLEAHTCVVAGWSGGGPHALACGAVLADRVRAVLCIAGVAPFDAEGLDFLAGMGEENLEEFGAARAGEPGLRAYLDEQHDAMREITGSQLAEQMATLLPPADLAELSGDYADSLAEEFRQAVSHGVDGWLDDDLAFSRPWGFELADISVPTYLWQGSDDLMVPFPTASGSLTGSPGSPPISSRVRATCRSLWVPWNGCSTSSSSIPDPPHLGHRRAILADMEEGEVVPVDEWLRLRGFAGDRDVDAALPWYADPATVVSVDGPGAAPYDRAVVAAMYDALAAQGDLFMIEVGTTAGWEPVGDVTLAPDTVPIVVAPGHRRRGIGRSVVLRLADRARVLGWDELRVREVHPENVASRALFESLGFVARPDPPPAYVLRLNPLVLRRRG